MTAKTKPSETPAPAEPTEKREKRIQVPAALVFQMLGALRAVARDVRRDDRSLHDETREVVVDACDAWNAYQDARLRDGAR